MTLIVALQGQNELVFAADTLVWDGVDQAYYKFHGSKLRVIGSNWISGTSGTGAGADVQARLAEAQETFDPDIDVGGPRYVLRTVDLYQKNHYVGETSFLLGGFNQNAPVIYRWSLPKFSGPVRCRTGRATLGIGEHGAMHFAAAYHNQQMTTEQRLLLAYFCVYEVARQDPRVGLPIELAVARRDGVSICTAQELARLRSESEALTGYLTAKFSALAIPRDPLLIT